MVRWLLPSAPADAPDATRRFETANHETTGETNAQEDCTHGFVRRYGSFRGDRRRQGAIVGSEGEDDRRHNEGAPGILLARRVSLLRIQKPGARLQPQQRRSLVGFNTDRAKKG